MKKSLVVLALLAAFGAHAQNNNSATGTGNATSNPVLNNAGNGNSSSGASVDGVTASSNPNNQANQQIQINTYAPDRQAVDSTSSSSSTQTYNGVQRNINEGTSTQRIEYSGTQTVKNVPGIAMSGPASGPCTGASGGLGVAGPGFGVGLNGAKVDDGCTVRENTRTLGQVYQSLDGADPLKATAKEAMLRGMAILDNMNTKIGGEYAPPAKAQPVATAQPAGYVAPQAGEPTDPYVRQRMGLPPLAK